MRVRCRGTRAAAIGFLGTLALASAAGAQPQVVATGEGQVGTTPDNPSFDRVHAPSLTPVVKPGTSSGVLLIAEIFQAGGFMPPSPHVTAIEDHAYDEFFSPDVVDTLPSPFLEVDKLAPGLDVWRNDPDLVSMSFLQDGSAPDTASVAIVGYNLTSGTKIIDVEIPDVPTFMLPDEFFSKTDVAMDEFDFVTAVFNEVPSGMPPKVRAARVNGQAGTLADVFDVSDDGISPDLAIFDFDGKAVVVSVDVTTPDAFEIQGNFIDFLGPTPAVSPEFDISTTAAASGNFRPVVAADPVTGEFFVAWDHLTGVAGDPSDIRGRRYEAAGSPVGDDFQVNVTALIGDDNDQGQADVAYGPGGIHAATWAAAGTSGDPDTDVFARVFLPGGTPILEPGGNLLLAGQFKVNTGNTPGGPLADRQDRPKIEFLPHPDTQGRPQIAVVWRDAGDGTGADPNGTGTSYRCFSIDQLEDVQSIFSDGFESGDTSSWSSRTP